jgi:hypothetical protein
MATMTEDQIVFRACANWMQRADYLGYKGKKRDDAALDFFAGFATMAEVSGRDDVTKRLATWMHMILAVRGHMAVAELHARLGERLKSAA